MLPLGTSLAATILLATHLYYSNNLSTNYLIIETTKIVSFWPAIFLPLLWPIGHFLRAKGMSQESVSGSVAISNTQIIFTIAIETILLGMGFNTSFLLATLLMMISIHLTFSNNKIQFNTSSYSMLAYVIIAASLNTIDSILLKQYEANLFVILFFSNFISLIIFFPRIIKLIKSKYTLLFGAIQIITLPAQQELFKAEGSSYAALIVALGYIIAKIIYNYRHKEISNIKIIIISVAVIAAILLATQ